MRIGEGTQGSAPGRRDHQETEHSGRTRHARTGTLSVTSCSSGRADSARAGDELPSALVAALGGDQQGFAVLYRHFHPQVLRLTAALVGADAEDVTAETWVDVTRNLHRFRGDLPGFAAWVATIARRRSTDQLRARCRAGLVLRRMAASCEWEPVRDPAVQVVERMATVRTLRAIADLPREQAAAVLLCVVAGLDSASAAVVLGKRPGAVRVCTHRGLQRLRAATPPPPHVAPPRRAG